MIHFPVLKLQVYLPTVHTFHTLVSHMHPDVAITLNKLSGRHLSLSLCFYSRVIKASLIGICNQIHAALEQRAAGPTLEGPGADAEAGVYGCVGRPPARCGGGVEGETPKPYQACFSGQRGSLGALYSPVSGPYWNSQQNNNGPLGVFEKQQR